MTRIVPALILLFLALPVHADEVPPYSPYYTGAFVAAGVLGGPSVTAADEGESAWSPTWGAWVQWSAPLQVIDVQLSWHRQSSAGVLPSGDGIHLDQDTLTVAGGLHPLFIVHLESSTLYYVLGGIYILAGVDLDFARVETGADVFEATDPGIQLGGGLDIPLDDVDDGGGFWLGLQYRHNTVDVPTGALTDVTFIQHSVFLRLCYRRNGLLVAM